MEGVTLTCSRIKIGKACKNANVENLTTHTVNKQNVRCFENPLTLNVMRFAYFLLSNAIMTGTATARLVLKHAGNQDSGHGFRPC